jgi:hypothetical protein
LISFRWDFVLLLTIDGTADVIFGFGQLLDDMKQVEDQLCIGKLFLYRTPVRKPHIRGVGLV